MAQKNLETWRRHHSRTFLCCLRPQTKNISYHYHFHYHHQNLCTAVNLWSFSELITARRREARQWQWQRQGLNNLHSLPSPRLNIANHDQTLPFSISNIANPWPETKYCQPETKTPRFGILTSPSPYPSFDAENWNTQKKWFKIPVRWLAHIFHFQICNMMSKVWLKLISSFRCAAKFRFTEDVLV